MAEPRLTAAVVGGGSGGRLSLAALHAAPHYELMAAVDMRAEVRADLEARYAGLRTYASHQELLATCPTDVVCVSTWPPSHKEVALAALASGVKGLLCEKPLADTAAQGADILAALKASRTPVVVPHGLLKNRHAEQILERVHGGEIGALELVEIECNKWDIINAGIHWLNYFVNLAPDDPMAWVMALAEASTSTFRDGMEVETAAITYVQTASGVRAVMHTGDDVLTRSGKDFTFRLVGTLGVIEFWAWESAYRLVNAAHPRGELFEVPRYAESAHQRYLDELAKQIADGQPDYALPERSLVALELCEGAYLSSAHRAKVTLPLSEWHPLPEPDWRPGQPYRGQGGRDGRKL
jgi:predicted dehydrogenase